MRHGHLRRAARLAAAVILAAGARDAGAQLKGHYIAGFAGLQSGTQPPPGVSLIVPSYFYTTDDLRNDAGDRLGGDARVGASFVGAGLAWVTNVKVLGANLGGAYVPVAFTRSRIEGPSLDVPGSFAFSDMQLQPVQLGWHTRRADFVAGYAVFIPTGEWKLGGGANAGLGMWSHLLQAGTTLHLDGQRRWSVSSLASYELHSDKDDTDIRVGDILSVEGGLGRSFYRLSMAGGRPVPSLVTNVGLVYYGQLKTTADRGGLLTPLAAGRRDRAFGAGVEGNVILPSSGLVLGLRAEREFAARNRTQGWAFVLTLAYSLQSLVQAAAPAAP